MVELDRQCFAEAWTRGMWEDELARTFCELWGVFAVDPAMLLGYSCVWHLAGEAHILRIATDPKARRCGIGRRMMNKILQQARLQSCEQVQLEVASRNTPAIELYLKFGFSEVGRRKHYYRNPTDDAVLMTYRLTA